MNELKKGNTVMWRPCYNHHHGHRHRHHHHHHHHHECQLFLCPHNVLHRRHVCPNYFPSLPVNPNDVVVSVETPSVLKDKENEGLEEEVFEDEDDDDDDDEPVFVLTDEWRDFFAKSEAKRKLEKKLAKKGKKN